MVTAKTTSQSTHFKVQTLLEQVLNIPEKVENYFLY